MMNKIDKNFSPKVYIYFFKGKRHGLAVMKWCGIDVSPKDTVPIYFTMKHIGNNVLQRSNTHDVQEVGHKS